MKIQFAPAYNSNYQYNSINNNTIFGSRPLGIPKEELKSLFETGYSVAEVAKIKGKSVGGILHLMEGYGIKTKHMEKISNLKANLSAHLANGELPNEIAKCYGFETRVVVYHAKKMLGIDEFSRINKQIKADRKLKAKEVKQQAKQDRITSRLSNVLGLIEKGKSLFRASRETGMDTSTVLRHTSKEKIADAQNIARENDLNKIKYLIGKGYTISQIGKELNCSPESVYRKMGKEYRAEWREIRNQQRREDIKNYRQEGISNSEISEKMGISTATIKRLMKGN